MQNWRKKKNELVKAAVVQFLKENLDMEEEDFLSAELEIVPAGKRETADWTEAW